MCCNLSSAASKRAEKKKKWSTGGEGGRGGGLRNVYAFQTALFRLHVSRMMRPVNESSGRQHEKRQSETAMRNGRGSLHISMGVEAQDIARVP